MNYEKAYKEALERARSYYNNEEARVGMTPIDLEEIFPELAESEDERIRKEIIAFLTYYHTGQGNSVKYDDGWIDWLEKQGEQKYTQRDIDDAYLKGITDTKHEIEKESEKDKKIRTDIAEFIFKSQENIKDRSKWIEYLGCIPTFVGEKNKIQKEAQKSVDKVEPRFHECDWIVNNDSGGVYQVTEITDDEYCLWPLLNTEIMGYLRIIDVDNGYHLWTIQDAKDGDVLACGDKVTDCPFIFHNLTEELNPRSYCGVGRSHHFQYNDENGGFWCYSDEVRPATKEQRDLLFQSMKEAGYEWDAEKKELKKIDQKSAWSYEDEANLNNIIWLCNNCINGSETTWIPSQATRIKSLIERIKDTVFLQSKQQWSEEDERNLEGIIDEIEANKNQAPDYDIVTYDRFLSWLKSLKPQNKRRN